MTITLVIIIVTVLISLAAFNSGKIMEDLIFYPPAVTYQRQWYRFFTCGFIHADFGHLFFNMFALFLFGQGSNKTGVESTFVDLFQEKGKALYLVLYILALFFSLLPTYLKNRTNTNYRSLGASGAVSAIIFAGILLFPNIKIGFFFIPPIIPGYIFGPLYLIISHFMGRRGGDNINHSAHIWGALFGIAFLLGAGYLFSDYNILQNFIDQVQESFRS